MEGGGKEEGGWVAADARATTGARRREAATEKRGDDALTRSRSAGLKCTIMWYGVESAAGLIESSAFGLSPPPTPQGLRCCILLEGAMVEGEGGWVAASVCCVEFALVAPTDNSVESLRSPTGSVTALECGSEEG